MDLAPLIDEIASQADDFLSGISSRQEARAGIAELLTSAHPQLGAGDRRRVTDRVMEILEAEDFFAAGPGGGSAAAEDNPTDEE